jgi:hypothetical protein
MNHKNYVQQEATFKKVIRSHRDEVSVLIKREEPKVRYLKLYPFYRESKSNRFFKSIGQIVPELRLCGNWLENAGFFPTNYVSVTVMDKLLIIRPVEKMEGSTNDTDRHNSITGNCVRLPTTRGLAQAGT